MNLSFTYSPFFLLIIFAVAAVLSVLMYRLTNALLPKNVRYLLTAFRFIVLSLLGLLLLEPLLNSLSKIEFPPIIAVLQDDTESLVIQPDSQFVRESYPQLLKSFVDEFEGEEYETSLFGFARDVQANMDIDSLQFNQTGTNISQALKRIQSLYQNQNLGAVVLVGDGITTAGVNPLYNLEGFNKPIYTVLLGDTTAQQDIQIKEVLFNEIAYLNNEMPIRVKVRSTGYDQAKLKVTIRSSEKVLSTQNVSLSRNQSQEELSFLIKPEKVGLQRYIVDVTRMDREITYRNNRSVFFVNVLETRVKIALFAGAPHPDIGALRQAFQRDESYEVSEFISRTPGSFYEDPGRVNLADYDLFILHNFPGISRDAEIVGQILEEIKERKKPVIYFNGAFTDLRTMQPLFEYMGLAPKGFSPKSEEIIANFAFDYREHSTYTFEDEWINWINNAPPLYRNQSNWEAKTTAKVFATAKIKNIALDYPVYALQNHLGRKNMVFLGENFWRIRAHSYLESDDFEWFDAWLFNNIKWLIVSDDKRKFKVSPSKRIFSGSEPVLFKGQVYDESYNPIAGADIKLTIKAPDGKENDYYLKETGQAQYFLELFNLEEGAYSYRAEGKVQEILVGRDQGEFSIGRSNIEHFRLQADRDLMQQIALRTGGDFVHARDLDQLAAKIKAKDNLKPVLDYKKQKTSFHDFWWILVLLLSLLSVEWVVRKLYSLL